MANKVSLPLHNLPLTLGPYNRMVLIGGGEILRNLCEWAPLNHYSVSVITAPRHAEEKINGDTLQSFLKRRGIGSLITEQISTSEVKDFIENSENTFFLSLGAAWIFNTEIIEKYFSNRLFNLHGTRLPQNRGGGGFSWQVLTSNRFGICVLHNIDGGIDTGSIICFEEFLYPATCRIPRDYFEIYNEKNFRFITRLLMETREVPKKVRVVDQTEYLSTYWPRLHTITNAWIDWKQDYHELERFICAFDEPYAGAQTFLNGKKVHIKSVSLNFQDGLFHSYQAGLVYRKSKHWLCVGLKGAGLIVERVEDENGNDIFESIRIGDRLFTPNEELENANRRVVYSASVFK